MKSERPKMSAEQVAKESSKQIQAIGPGMVALVIVIDLKSSPAAEINPDDIGFCTNMSPSELEFFSRWLPKIAHEESNHEKRN